MRLSGDLPALATRGNRIVAAATGEPVLLRGLNRPGLEYAAPDEQGFLSGAGITSVEIREITRVWNANILRMPFNQDWALRGRNAWSAEAYLSALDQIVAWASANRAYTLLALQWLSADVQYGSETNYIAPLPDAESVELWAMLADRYRDEPAVLFDIYTEPHDRLPRDPHPLIAVDGSTFPGDRVGPEEWRPWAQRITAAIRERASETPVFISGCDWGYDLRDVPFDADNIVYGTHVYPGKHLGWDEAFGDLSARLPVFAAEWGGMNSDLRWGRKLLRYLDERGIGWTAWSWCNDPMLMTRYVPTRFGELVRESLTGDPAPGKLSWMLRR